MHSEIADRREHLAELCRCHGVIRLEVFGSAARGEDFDPMTSDADFVVEFGLLDGRAQLKQYFDFAEALSDALGRPVDLIESGAIRNPHLRTAIDRSRELVFAV